MNERFDAIVVGGGIGGLASAALLSARGQRMLLLEASDRLGGFQHRFERAGFTFEPHFHFLQDAGPGRPVRALLEGLGLTLDLIPLDPVAVFRFPDRDVIWGKDRAAFIARLQADFPDDAAGIAALYESSHAVYQAITRQQPSPQLGQFAADTMDAYASRFVRDARLKAIVGAWSAYFGYASSQIAAFAIIVFSEACWDGGVHHPAGGITSVVRGLRDCIERAGGSVRTEAPVRRILVESGRASGVELADGSTFSASAVVCNADARTTFHDLLAGEPAAQATRERMARLRPFRSPFCVYLGVRSAGLELRTGAAVRVVFDSHDLTAQDAAQLRGDVSHAPLSLGVPTRTNPALAPAGHDIVILYTFIGADRIAALLRDADAAHAYAKQLVQQAERVIPGLSAQLVLMETSATATPRLYTPHTQGAIGWAPTPDQLPHLPPQRSDIAGLYLAGQWTQTGAGMNNIFASAQIVASLLAQEQARA